MQSFANPLQMKESVPVCVFQINTVCGGFMTLKQCVGNISLMQPDVLKMEI